MNGQEIKILFIEDEENDYIWVRDMLSDIPSARFRLDWISNYEEAVAEICRFRHDVYLLDYRLGVRDGLELLREPIVKQVNAPIILMTGRGNYTVDVEAMKAGATDYLVKGDVTAPLLDRTIRYAVDRKRTERKLIATAEEIARLYSVEARRARELDALHRATAALLSTIELESLLGYILDAAQSAIPQAEKGLLHLAAPDTGQLQIRATSGFSDPRIVKLSLMHSQDFISQAARDRRPLNIQDTQDYPIEVSSHDHSGEMRSAVIAPLILGERVLGVLSLSASNPDVFSESDLRVLESFATTTTAALQNAMLHAEVQKLALTDALTEVYNRRGLFEVGKREVERAHRFNRPLSAILVDVDHLKQINDTFGHAAGDESLRIVAERFRSSIREVDVLGRYGGDEFVFLLPETDLFTACGVAERIRQRVTEPMTLTGISANDNPVVMTISLGVANAVADTTDLESLLHRADAAAYEAKKNGRNRVEIG